ncbi:MAG TPA: tetratricopeptide repeat protein [Flavihumibacter sp.]|nr:tetratricopeptide repeat protein [Bacteroidota bacterium]HOA38706.1 tetratricopeptide repeat protein [Flavihumibacter sp.]HPZ88895.1 tetratricopeptide repeat protein [Flavihumibacter sp.]
MTDRITKLRGFLATNPSDAFLQHALALEWIKAGDEPQARAVFEKLLGETPGYVGSYYHLAKLLERQGETEGAINWYQQGMEAAQKAGDQHAYSELRSALEELQF